jgi:hypothetical protein
VIPGVSTKPVLDLLAEARDIGEVNALNPAMIALGFWDHLRADSQEARAYSRLKEELPRRLSGDIEGYLVGNDGFIWRIEAQARELRGRAGDRPPGSIDGIRSGGHNSRRLRRGRWEDATLSFRTMHLAIPFSLRAIAPHLLRGHSPLPTLFVIDHPWDSRAEESGERLAFRLARLT